MYPNKVFALALVSEIEPPTNGNVILSSPEHPLNALDPILVTELGISMLVRNVQPLNA